MHADDDEQHLTSGGLTYWNSFAVAFSAIKIKSYLHVSYMQLFEYLRIHNITYIAYLNIKKMKI